MKVKKPIYKQYSTWTGILTILGAIGSVVCGVSDPTIAISVGVGGLMQIMYPEKKKIV